MKKLMVVLALLSSVWILNTLASGAYVGIVRVPRPPAQDQDQDKEKSKANDKKARDTKLRQAKPTPTRTSSTTNR